MEKNCITVGELPTKSPYGILSATQDGRLVTAAALDGGAYAGRIIVTDSGHNPDPTAVCYGEGKKHTIIQPCIATYIWKRTA